MTYENPLFAGSVASTAIPTTTTSYTQPTTYEDPNYPNWLLAKFGSNGTPAAASAIEASIQGGVLDAFRKLDGTGIFVFVRYGQEPNQLISEVTNRLRHLILLEVVQRGSRIPVVAAELATMAIASRLAGHCVKAGGPTFLGTASNHYGINLQGFADALTAKFAATPNPLHTLAAIVQQQQQPVSTMPTGYSQPASQPVFGATESTFAASLVSGNYTPENKSTTPLEDGQEEYVHHNDDGTTEIRRRSIRHYAQVVKELTEQGVELTALNIQKAMMNTRPVVIPTGTSAAKVTSAYDTALNSSEGVPDMDWDKDQIWTMDQFEELQKIIALRSNAISATLSSVDERRELIENTRTSAMRRRAAYDNAVATNTVIYFDHVGKVLPGVEGATAYHDWLDSKRPVVEKLPTQKDSLVVETPKVEVVPHSFGGMPNLDEPLELQYGAATPEDTVVEHRPLKIPAGVCPAAPSVGLMKAMAGETPTMDDYQQRASFQELHDHIGDDVTYEDDAMEQSLFSDMDNDPVAPEMAVDPLVEQFPEHLKEASFDEIMDAVKDAGHELSPIALEQVWESIPLELRKSLIRANRLIVPVYLRGIEEVIMTRIDDIITLRVQKIVDREAHVIRNKIASWDSSANDVSKGTDVIATAYSAKAISADTFVEALNAKLETVGENEEDLALAHVLETSPVVEIEGALTSVGAGDEFQNEIEDALSARGVTKSQINNVLQNAVITYARFDTNLSTIDAEESELIYSIRDSQTAQEVVSNVNIYRSTTSQTMRDISRNIRKFNKLVGHMLRTQLGAAWEIGDYYEDLESLIVSAILELNDKFEEDHVVKMIDKAFVAAANVVFNTIDLASAEDEEPAEVVGMMSNMVLLPIYYTQYPIYVSDNSARVDKEVHPELHNLLTNVDNSESIVTKLITLDNVVLTFVTCDDEHYLVEITE